jgi:inner membrane protein
MEPVTHLLTGACLARAGLNRRAAYATLAMMVAAELPDIDTLWSLDGPVVGFAHHRGITHTFVALPVEAAVVVAAVWGLHAWRVRRSSAVRTHASSPAKPLTKAPVRWGLLYLFALLALGSHLLLDWTNNYGVRPFFPFNAHWYAGSFVFIFDPLLFALLLVPLVMPRLFALVSSEVGSRRAAFRGRWWSTAALVLIAAYWGLRAYEHAQARALAAQQTIGVAAAGQGEAAQQDSGEAAQQDSSEAAQQAPLAAPDTVAEAPPVPPRQWIAPQRVWVSADPLSPFRWHAALDFGDSYRLAEIDTRRGEIVMGQQIFAKAAATPNVLAAERTRLGRVYLDWSQMPLVTERRTPPEEAVPGAPADVVLFRDLRFAGDVPILRSRSRLPLTGEVDFDAAGRILDVSLDGAHER